MFFLLLFVFIQLSKGFREGSLLLVESCVRSVASCLRDSMHKVLHYLPSHPGENTYPPGWGDVLTLVGKSPHLGEKVIFP